MKKRILCLILVAVMAISLVPAAFAASDEANAAADALNALGLFEGTGTTADGKPIYELERAPTRHEAVTMLVRILGKEEEALNGTWDMPFTDVADWAKPYVGYAYANGLTSGTSDTTYSGGDYVTASQYITFVLRALGYSSERDFKWDKAWEFSDEIGLTDGRYNEKTTEFLRADVAIISYSSTFCERHVDIFADIPEETAKQKKDFALLNSVWDTRYRMPRNAKGLTLTWDEARALVGQDIDTVKRYVKSIEDCLYYMCAAGYKQVSGDLRYRSGTIEWHFNYSPQEIFRRNEGNCGGGSGLVAYLLQDDYDEVGFACYRGAVGDGGHVVNYVKNGDFYYVFDVNMFAGSYDRGLGLVANTDLNEAVKHVFAIEKEWQREHPAMMAFTYTGCWDGDAPMGWPDGPTHYLVDGYAENVNIVYERPEEGYVFEFIDVDQKVLDKIEEIRNPK